MVHFIEYDYTDQVL